MTFVMLIGFTTAKPSQNQGLMNPGQKPGDLLYGLDRASERVARAVASAPVIGSEELKSKVLANQAEERLSEAKTLVEKNRSDKAEKLMEEYQKTLNKSISSAERANKTELSDSLENVTSKHVKTLQDVQNKVPGPAKAGIQKAIDNAEKSRKGLEKARKSREARERANTGKPPVGEVQGPKEDKNPDLPGRKEANSGKDLADENGSDTVNQTLNRSTGSSTDLGKEQNSSGNNPVTGDFSENPGGEVPGFDR